MALNIFGLQSVLKESGIISIYNKAVKRLKIKKDINLIFVGEAKTIELNYVYRGKKEVTDVLSFNLEDSDNILGEIYIHIPKVKKNAKEYGLSETEELNKVIVHGILHLNGYRHNNKEKKILMDKKEEEILKTKI